MLRYETHTHGDEGDGGSAPDRESELRAIAAMLDYTAERARAAGDVQTATNIERVAKSLSAKLGAGG